MIDAAIESAIPEVIWDVDERAAWHIPPKLKPSQWSEQNRVIPETKTSRPGPWRNENQPVLGPLMDLCDLPGIQEVNVEKAAQMGGTEFGRNYVVFTAISDPSGWLYVFPNEKDGRKQIKKYIRPLFDGREVPSIKPLVSPRSSDKTQSNITLLNGADIQLGYSGSATSLAGEPRKRVFLDEVNKFAPFKGIEANAVDLATVRTSTYPDDYFILAISTPTTDVGEITIRRERSAIQLAYYIECPHCRVFQTMVWNQVKCAPNDQKLERDAWANKIENEKAAWYECTHCKQTWTDDYRRSAIVKGFWGTGTNENDWKLWADGRITGNRPLGKSVGVLLSGLLDICRSFWGIMAKWIRASANPADLMHVKNSELGEPYHWDAESVNEDLFAKKCKPNPEIGFKPGKAKLVPAWASRLIMTVDMQKNRFYVVVRAWGARMRSRRIWHGYVTTWRDLETLESMWWSSEDPTLPQRCIFLTGIDTGGGMNQENKDSSRTEEAYRWCAASPEVRVPLKGSSGPIEPQIRAKWHEYQPPKGGEKVKVYLHWIDPIHWRDLLAGYVRAKLEVIDTNTGELLEGEIDKWELNDANDPEYNNHLAALIRVTKPRKGASKRFGEVSWIPQTVGRRHDFHDCESYALALAHGPGKCFGLADEQTIRAQLKASQAPLRQIRPTGIKTPDGRPFHIGRRK